MSPRAHQTPPEPDRIVETGTAKSGEQWRYPSDHERDTRHLDASFMHPRRIDDWPLPSHPEYPPEDEGQETPDA